MEANFEAPPRARAGLGEAHRAVAAALKALPVVTQLRDRARAAALAAQIVRLLAELQAELGRAADVAPPTHIEVLKRRREESAEADAARWARTHKVYRNGERPRGR